MSAKGLRFAMITTFYPPYHFGGDGNYVRQLTHALAKRGHRVDVIHATDAYRIVKGDLEPTIVSEPQGVHVYGLRSRVPWLSCLITHQLGRPLVHGEQINRLLSRHVYDVIHFHNVSLVGGPGVLAYGDAIKIYTAHEHWLICPTHVLWRHNREVCNKRECLRCVLRYRRPPQLWRKTGLLKRMAKHVNAFCSPSNFSIQKHAEFEFRRKFNVLPPFLPSPSGSEQANSRTASKSNRHRFFFIVGRLEKIKGIQHAIPLFHSDINAELWIAGTGDYEDELRRLADGYKRVKFLGQLTPKQLEPLYVNALAVILPSICYEVFPLVVLEAFRAGTPIVARELGPFPEIVQQSKAGLLFKNSHEMKDALLRLMSDQELRRQLGQAGYLAFNKYWSEKASMSEYFRLIENLAREADKNHTLSVLQSCSEDGSLDC